MGVFPGMILGAPAHLCLGSGWLPSALYRVLLEAPSTQSLLFNPFSPFLSLRAQSDLPLCSAGQENQRACLDCQLRADGEGAESWEPDPPHSPPPDSVCPCTPHTLAGVKQETGWGDLVLNPVPPAHMNRLALTPRSHLPCLLPLPLALE